MTYPKNGFARPGLFLFESFHGFQLTAKPPHLDDKSRRAWAHKILCRGGKVKQPPPERQGLIELFDRYK
jgi:hypothetical protein